MIVVAKTLGLMEIWNIYFWTTFAVPFIVTAITVRIWPLRSMSEEYYNGQLPPKETFSGSRLQAAWKEAMDTAAQSPG
ncbi:hypothetical protein OSM87_25730, partial [Escherichia coli]|nr:hypothetical protein [Escherichia coli]